MKMRAGGKVVVNIVAAGLGAELGGRLGVWIGDAAGSADDWGLTAVIFGYAGVVVGASVALAATEEAVHRSSAAWSWGSAAPWFAILVTPLALVIAMLWQPDLVEGPRDALGIPIVAAAVIATWAAARNRHDWIEPGESTGPGAA